ncbi:MAG: peptide-methionine (S)-S-oxide reductase MsrA [Planctomycetota bacterium]|nr:peptide-methionine (S)-S-oxide reductase MsrA [Planctomycetota bacterium]MDA1162149.1 peptide-methionine (S)-S-oxide reductase MsrA [Planctomycetota bacterium]
MATSLATFGSGCFWCTEAVFQYVRGVSKVVSGYSGGDMPSPDYKAVCTGTTGHAECVQITFDPEVVSYVKLLNAFFKTHDPTTLNQQGADRGTQYRSVIYFHDAGQRRLAESYRDALNDAKVFARPIVTEISPAVEFFPAENYHQSYFMLNSGQAYCQAVITPKLQKFQKELAELLKS